MLNKNANIFVWQTFDWLASEGPEKDYFHEAAILEVEFGH